MKKLRIVNKRKFITTVTILLIVIISCLSLVKVQTTKAFATEEYIVCEGDTLWDIAEQYCDKDTDIREWIYEVQKLNNMKTSELQPGQTLQVIK